MGGRIRAGVNYSSMDVESDQSESPTESTSGRGWSPDEVTVSKDMKTLGVSVNVIPGRGVDQLRVLVLSKN